MKFHTKVSSKTEVIMYESGDTATETVLMAAARIPGKTVIKFASPNYQVQDVCFYLEKLGVKSKESEQPLSPSMEKKI
jgi:UDP-N-acetylglucosamine 1-carboxyvinyltransferase